MERRLLVIVTAAAVVGAILWGIGIGFTVVAYDAQNATAYSPRTHFISDLGFPGSSSRAWLFNLAEALGSLISLPIVCALARHLRSWLAGLAAGLASGAFLAGSFVGVLGLAVDCGQPPRLPLSFLGGHVLGAVACFCLWSLAVALFTVAFVRQRSDFGARAMAALGAGCFVVAGLLFATGISAVNRLNESTVRYDPMYRALWHSEAAPRAFLGWLDTYRQDFGWLTIMEWSLLVTMFLWHGAAVVFLWQAARQKTAEDNASGIRPAAGTATEFARWVSIVGHPFTFVVFLLLLPYLRRGHLGAVRIAGVVTAIALVPLGLFMRERFRSGKWQTVDASARRDRPVAFLAMAVALLVAAAYFFFVERSAILVRGCLVIGAMIVIGAAANRWIKGSGHVAFATFSAVVLVRVNVVFPLVVAAFVPLLAWSRLQLQRHTPLEVVCGGLVGAAAGGVMLGL